MSFELFSFILIISLNLSIASQIAIDLGSEFHKVSLVKGKVYEMVENVNSKFKTSTVIHFKDNRRIFESEALSKKIKYPKETFTYLSNFLGEEYTSPFLKKYLEYYFIDYPIEENNKTHSTQFDLQYHNKHIKIPIEGMFAMLLRHIQSMAELFSHSAVDDCYMTIPSFYTYKHRIALSQAAKIARLPLIGFVSDNIAAAVYFSLKNSFDHGSYYIFYNMGASYTQALLVRFKKVNKNSEIQVLSEAYDKTLGGNRLTRNLVVEIIRRFNLQYKLNATITTKLYNKILPHAQKYQEILSANKEAQISILNVEKGLDFNDRITRKQFERINNETFNLIYEPINKVLKYANMNITQIHQIELIGGSIRIPFIQAILKRQIGNNTSIIGTHLNGDDSIALGAAYMLSNYTKTLRSHKITLLENNSPSASLSAIITNLNKRIEYCVNDDNQTTIDPFTSFNNSCIHYLNQKELLIPIRSSYSFKKMINIKHDSDLLIEIYETIEQGNSTSRIMQFNITGISNEINSIKSLIKSNKVHFPYIHLQFTYDNLGELTLSSYASFEVIYYYTNMTEFSNDTNTTTPNSTTHYQMQYDYVPYYINEIPSDQKENLTIQLNKSIELNLTDNEVKHIRNQLKIGTTRRQLIKRDLIVSQYDDFPKSLDMIAIENITKKLDMIDEYEANESKIIELKNKLETIVYMKKSWLDNEESKLYGIEKEFLIAKEILNDIGVWFDNEGADANYNELEIRINNLTIAFGDFDRRIKRNIDRMTMIEKFNVNLKTIDNKVKKIFIEKPWIEEYYEVNFTLYVNEMKQSLNDHIIKQNMIPLFEEPLLLSDAIFHNITMINNQYEMMIQIAKPRHPSLPQNKKISQIYHHSLIDLIVSKL